jgi:mannose-6-phosphate isomerase-like protein (cupin superfamily)
MTTHTRYTTITAFRTKDGSEIRELMHPQSHGNRTQSLAEARVAPGDTTRLHRHRSSEELYHVTRGEGWMTLGDRQFEVRAGDTVAILPGTAHCIHNTGSGVLVILCCCSPPYSDADTELLD